MLVTSTNNKVSNFEVTINIKDLINIIINYNGGLRYDKKKKRDVCKSAFKLYYYKEKTYFAIEKMILASTFCTRM
jgi:hypothetical protein